MEPILSMRNIDKYFFGIPANQNVCLDVNRGEIHALLGENGAGKTTLMNILYGLYSHDGGEIWWKGQRVEFRSPKDAIACKIGMVHQHFSLVPNLTVSENITLKHYMNTTWVARPLPEDMPSNEELFGDFFKPGMDEE